MSISGLRFVPGHPHCAGCGRSHGMVFRSCSKEYGSEYKGKDKDLDWCPTCFDEAFSIYEQFKGIEQSFQKPMILWDTEDGASIKLAQIIQLREKYQKLVSCPYSDGNGHKHHTLVLNVLSSSAKRRLLEREDPEAYLLLVQKENDDWDNKTTKL